ncbi:hypothetical protein KCP69_03245 [Salmonella enterica subsp. enterica]|nr:hypothetical protein KCP69_03245 [Salmonella enterica subsp. enterica]
MSLTQCVLCGGRIVNRRNEVTAEESGWCRQRLNPLVSTLCYVSTHAILARDRVRSSWQQAAEGVGWRCSLNHGRRVW